MHLITHLLRLSSSAWQQAFRSKVEGTCADYCCLSAPASKQQHRKQRSQYPHSRRNPAWTSLRPFWTQQEVKSRNCCPRARFYTLTSPASRMKPARGKNFIGKFKQGYFRALFAFSVLFPSVVTTEFREEAICLLHSKLPFKQQVMLTSRLAVWQAGLFWWTQVWAARSHSFH